MEDKDNVFTNDKDIVGKKIKSSPVPQPGVGIDVKKEFINNIIAKGESGRIDLATLESFSNCSQNREQIYELLDTMSEDATIAAVLETYAEDATEYNDQGQIVWVEAQDSNINKFVTYLLNSMQVNKNIYKWVYSLCKYGDIYWKLFKQSDIEKDKIFTKSTLNEDIKIKAYKENDNFVHYVELVPNPAEMFDLTRFGKSVGYVKADVKYNLSKKDNLNINQYKYNFKKGDVTLYDATMFVHASLEDNTSRTPEEVNLFLDENSYNKNEGITYIVKRGQSLLYNVFKIWRELALLENSMLLNRITKSAIVRLINVEVGDMAPEMIGPHLQGIKNLMEQKAAINEGNSMTEYTNPGPIENNIYVPTNNGKGAISADQIGGDVEVGKLSDIDYFQNKFFGALRIPKQYFGLTEDGAGFNGGQSLAIISSRYAKMIKRIQNTVIQGITDIINLFLIDKGLNSYINQFTIKMQPPTTQEEIDRRDNTASHVQIVSDIMNLLSDVENPIIKMKILKDLISNVITDTEVISLLQNEIENMENNANTSATPNSNGQNTGDVNFNSNSDLSSVDSTPLDLDKELDLGDEFNNELNSEESNENILPTPEETGIDMTQNIEEQ